MDEKSAAADPGSMEAISGTPSNISYPPPRGAFLEGAVFLRVPMQKSNKPKFGGNPYGHGS